MEILFLLLGIVLGIVLGYFISNSRGAGISKKEHRQIQQDILNLQMEKSALSAQLKQKHIIIEKAEKELKEASLNVITFSKYQSELEAINNNLREKLNEQKQEQEKQHLKMLQEFENVSSKVIRQNSDDFSRASKERLEMLLKPFQEKVKELETQVKSSYEKTLTESYSLREMVMNLAELNKQIGLEAQNLTKALKGEKKMQGNWGENLLEVVLEKSGLQENYHYVREEQLKNEEGTIYRPDVIVNLPESKHLVIDSKVSLNAYEASFNADEVEEQEFKLKDHIKAVKDHINTLGGKNYHKLHGINSPDFVLMYIPVEPAFNLAMQYAPELFSLALEKNVVIVTNSTLLATLKTVAGIWKQEDQKRNVLAIAEMGGKLYDKFAGFVEDMEKIGSSIGAASKAHEAAFNKLAQGRGNLLSQAEKLKKMGAKANKSINNHLLKNDDDSKHSDIQ